MIDIPPVSCMCLTFGRPKHIIEEAVQSFLQQDYRGRKELVILNDFDKQRIVFNHPEVKVVNVSKRYESIGEKRNACVRMCSYDHIAVWDDDDIYLPHRLSYSMMMYDPLKRYFKPSKAWVMNDNVVSGPQSNLYHSGSMWHRSLFDAVDGYAHMGSGEDMDLELKFEKIIGPGKNYDEIKPEEIYYIYRWAGTNSYHLSAFGVDKENEKSGNWMAEYYVLTSLKNGKINAGEIKLEPSWRSDYTSIIKAHIASISRL
jgi:glycosyltransferase involved in cell wall biosynthesis